VERITTRAGAEARGRKVRQTLLTLMGGLPADRTPLNVRKTRTIDRGDYRIENLVFESLPRFYVTANLYIPQTGRGPYPAVLQPTGHSVQAKSRAVLPDPGAGPRQKRLRRPDIRSAGTG
jgi:hypothetical protein